MKDLSREDRKLLLNSINNKIHKLETMFKEMDGILKRRKY